MAALSSFNASSIANVGNAVSHAGRADIASSFTRLAHGDKQALGDFAMAAYSSQYGGDNAIAMLPPHVLLQNESDALTFLMPPIASPMLITTTNILPRWDENSTALLTMTPTTTALPPKPVASSKATAARRKRRSSAGTVALTVNTVGCNGKSAKDLYSAVAVDLGWREVDVGPVVLGQVQQKKIATIFCVTQTNEMLDRLPLLGKRSWVTRYLGCPDLCEKGNFARIVATCHEYCNPGDLDFIPQTWVLPDHKDSLRAAMAKSKSTFIVKPADGAQGDGIFLVRGLRDLECKMSVNPHGSAVVQRYLEKPLLLRGVKFDLRMYVCFIGGSDNSPPQVFVCREGLARFCTESYEEPAASNMHKCMGHLTNYSLNKRSDKFEHAGESMQEVFDQSSTASKRPLTAVLEQMEAECPGFDSDAFYESVANLVQGSASIMAPVLSAYHRGNGGGEMQCFQMLGFDVILDEQFVPYLLEINNNPSLCIDEALPLDAAGAELIEGAGRPRTREKGKICRCMDMVQPHMHQTALVDLVVKKTAMAGAFRLLQQVGDGAEAFDDSYIPVGVADNSLYQFLQRIEEFFFKCGGSPKAFTSSSLRRNLGAACGCGRLQKLDLDTLSQKYRFGQFVTHDAAAKPDALRVFDFLDLLRTVSEKAFPGESRRDAVDRLLEVVGA